MGKTDTKDKKVSAQHSLEPSDWTDIGQANVFVREFGEIVRYTPATKFLVYDGKVWKESELKAQGLSQELTERQLREARERVARAQEDCLAASEIGDKRGIKAAKERLEKENAFHAYVVGRRKSSAVKAALTEVRPKVEIEVSELDHDGELLNTPDGTYNLRTGERQDHNPLDYCTKITSVSPDDENIDIYKEFLKKVTVNDADLEENLQEIAGMCAVGEVKTEAIIEAYGNGGNGKSTLFNLWSRILGDYSGSISSEVLTANCRKNKSPELAELRGKRLVIASELSEGQRLDTAMLKHLCSVDDIQAEKKYKDPFKFKPSHTVILYTNYLPRVSTNDSGTWDRIIAIPFNANFRGQEGEVKDYGGYLYEKCGGAVLSWIIEGAKKFIENGYKIKPAKAVVDAISEYREANDWFADFINEECEIGKTYEVSSGELYNKYREYCGKTGEFAQAQQTFNQARETAGYKARRTKKGVFVFGLKLKEMSEPVKEMSEAEFEPTEESWEYYRRGYTA